MARTSTLDALASEQLGVQIAEVEQRLTLAYATVGTSSVHALVERERARFAGARIHVFVPILVERAVRASLMSAAAEPA
ncbi:three-helix bundle dimerization domain-containing protein [Amycolatopsis sp. H20-H5]|uniref:three-helix bundle dimerization domain-containing protein n=1 Tax=Amycolatopsis sp. H20-H5 TaxID=3046309 RepID=UPI002DBEC166|nr:hypothetical protein [Amycolatopsis sp. H20-H5]MEC3980731.1 hypothetical protein [Amycolatopsis sp. H20-H5]